MESRAGRGQGEGEAGITKEAGTSVTMPPPLFCLSDVIHGNNKSEPFSHWKTRLGLS